MPQRLTICADDFALSPAISEAIADLAMSGPINAISCMAALPGWPRDSLLLGALPANIEIGLHLVLTDEVPLTRMRHIAPGGYLPGIDSLTRRAALRQLDLTEIKQEITAQFDRFIACHGRSPAFVDGHQHAHLLPGIRQIMLSETARRAPGAWVRNCTDRLDAMLTRPWSGKAIGSAWHSRGLAAAAARHGVACNDSFAGHYDFRAGYAELFPQFLRRPGAFHLVMCHPGAGDLAGDTIAAARRREAAALRILGTFAAVESLASAA